MEDYSRFPERRNQLLPRALRPLVECMRAPHELVWSWGTLPENTICVRLICEDILAETHRKVWARQRGGEGRAIWLKQVSRHEWKLVREDRWNSWDDPP